jgi:hypothetical protein
MGIYYLMVGFAGLLFALIVDATAGTFLMVFGGFMIRAFNPAAPEKPETRKASPPNRGEQQTDC